MDDHEVLQLLDTEGQLQKVLFDYEFSKILTQQKWSVNKNGYAVSTKRILMHRMVVSLRGENAEGLMVDHINGNRLDNRSCNLRVATAKQNAKNRHQDPIHDDLVGVQKVGGMFKTVHRNLECYENNDPRMCALCYDSIVTYCYGQGKRLNDNISEKPLEIERWNLSSEVLRKLEHFKSKHTDFKGVKKCKQGWKATLTIELGTFETQEEAARAYDRGLKIVSKDPKEIKSHELNFP